MWVREWGWGEGPAYGAGLRIQSGSDEGWAESGQARREAVSRAPPHRAPTSQRPYDYGTAGEVAGGSETPQQKGIGGDRL